jgi:hypothetical protein
MKVGDLVRDIADGEIGIIIGIGDIGTERNPWPDTPIYRVLRSNGLTDDMWKEELEVINESR